MSGVEACEDTRDEMISPPVANRSFLYDNHGTYLKIDKAAYATLDSLALKRTRLPLQLLPLDDNGIIDAPEKTDQTEKTEKRNVSRKASTRRPSFKTHANANPQWKLRSRTIQLAAKFESVEKKEYSTKNHNVNSGCARKVHNRIAKRTQVLLANKTAADITDPLLKVRSLPIGSSLLSCDIFEEKYSNKTSEQPEDSGKCDDSVFNRSKSLSSLDYISELKRIQNEQGSRNDVEGTGDLAPDGNKVGSEKETKVKKKKVKREFGFAKHVLHYVPISSHVKRCRKLKKSGLSCSTGSLKLGHADSMSSIKSSLKPKSLSREEMRSLSISTPTNFVHVASATKARLMEIDTKIDLEQVVFNYEQKFADLRIHENPEEQSDVETEDKSLTVTGIRSLVNQIDKIGYVEMKTTSTKAGDPSSDETIANEAKAECLEKGQVVKTGANEAEEKIYEAMSCFSISKVPQANNSFLWSNQVKVSTTNNINDEQIIETTDVDEHVYENNDDIWPNKKEEQSIYDDIGSPENLEHKSHPIDDEVYDDVMPSNYHSIINSSSTSALEESEYQIPDAVRCETRTEMTADCIREVGLVDECSDVSHENHYLSINEYSSVDEEEEEEEKNIEEEQPLYDDIDFKSQERINSLYGGIGLGSLVGIANNECKWENLDDARHFLDSTTKIAKNNCDQEASHEKTLPERPVQRHGKKNLKSSRKSSSSSSTQTTCDLEHSDASSDDSNYETLNSFRADFSSDSETEANSVNNVGQNHVPNSCLEAPTKPNPPPPREASMTHTLGQSIKMLRRTWTITKGSLGRIRRKTSVIDSDNVYENTNGKIPKAEPNIATNDHKKYFTFKKRSRKSLTSLSTFYLDNNNENGSARNNSCEKEETYSNRSIYCGTWKDNDSVQSEEYKEPLYQFYTAAAASFSLQSDSDGYEEVARITSLSDTTDLTKPGNLTLWCQTRQVINSDLLQKLSADEKRLQEAKFEILTSEVRYLNSLRVLNNEFANDHELIHEVLTPGERERLFGGVPSVLTASENFLAELESVWKENPMLDGLPEVVLNHAEKCLNVYVAYCSNQVCIDTTLKELKKRKEMAFFETVFRIEMRPACQHLPLHSFLMLPMQRVTRLPLLADAVLSKLPMDHPERPSWEKVFSSLNHVVTQCNEGARLAGQRAEMQALEKKLVYSSNITPIILRDRQLVRSGTVIHLTLKSDAEYKLTFGKKYHKTSLYLLLLTDYLLVTKSRSNPQEDGYTVIDTCKRNLITLEPVEEDSPFSGHHAMILTLLENYAGRLVEYTLACDSDTEKERWLDAVSPTKISSLGETLYESWDCPQVTALYSYTPTQPDELALQVGDVINVLRKLSDGWYHGEKLLDGTQGWFPANHSKEIASEHVRARNLRQRHRFLALSGSILQRRGKSWPY